MSLQFIVGPSGCGKSHYIYKKTIDEAVGAPEGRFYVIVPEQFSMETQLALAKMHPSHSLINIDILSFNRLAYRVFTETGMNSAPILDDTGKILMLRKIINDNQDALKVLKGTLGKTGAIADLNSILTEMVQYRVEPENIDLEDENISALLRAKIEDLRLIRNKFMEFIQSRYLTMEEVPESLSRVIEQYEPMRGAVIVFDGFTGFVPTQLLVIEKLLAICSKVIVTVTADRRAGLAAKSSPSNLFNMSHKMAAQLLKAAQDAKAKIEREIWIDHGEKSRFGNNKPLLFLENQLFRYEFKTFQEEQEAVHIGRAANARQEAEAACEVISNLVRTKGYRYRDFAFVTGDMEQYGALTEEVFGLNKIPCFLDQRQNVLGNEAVEFVRSAVEMAAEAFSYKSVFRWLKSGFAPLDDDEIFTMENYVLAAGIRGFSKYDKVWDRSFPTIGEDELPKINAVREKFVECTRQFRENFNKRGITVKQRTSALYELIADCNIQIKCKAAEEKFKGKGDLEKAGEYSQIYRAIMDVLEKIVEILGEEKVSLRLYKQLIDAAFEEMRLGLIPAKQDQVLIGDIERSRLGGIRVMFFAGLNEGIVPKEVARPGILSQNDRQALSNMDIALAPDDRERMYRQRLYLYLSLTKPSERLYLSYASADLTGGALSVSYLINVIREMFPKIEISDLRERRSDMRMETIAGREEVLTDGYANLSEKAPNNIFLELVSCYLGKKEEQRRIQRLNEAIFERCPSTDIRPVLATSLYGVGTAYSASRLEMFGKCGFQHLLKYAFNLKERDMFEFTAADIGSILHEAIRIFCERMKTISWGSISDSQRDKIADEAFAEAYKNNFSASGSSVAFDFYKLGTVNRRAAWAIAQQVGAGSFIPYALEEKFMVGGVQGIIDRVDTCLFGDEEYIRIIDYKSSKKDINLNEFYYGTQIQLPLYMIAALELARNRSMGRSVKAAGMYYYGMEEPLVEVDSFEKEADSEKLLNDLKLSGLSIDEPEILRLMDASLSPGTASNIIPVEINKGLSKDGQMVISRKNLRTISAEDFYNLERYTKHYIAKARRMIEGGSAKIDPKIIGGTDSCKFCSYRGICRFDARVSGYVKREHPSLSNADIMEKIVSDLEAERTDNGN